MTGFAYRPEEAVRAPSTPNLTQSRQAASSCCDAETKTFCDSGYPIWVRWNRAQMLAYAHRDRTGYAQAQAEWRAHLREGGGR